MYSLRGDEMTMHCDPAYNDQIDMSDPRFGEDEPPAETLRDPNAPDAPEETEPVTARPEELIAKAASVWGEDAPESDRISSPEDMREAFAEYERGIYLDHCCDRDDR